MSYSGSGNRSKVSDPSGKKMTRLFKMQIYIAKWRGWLQMWYISDPKEPFKILFWSNTQTKIRLSWTWFSTPGSFSYPGWLFDALVYDVGRHWEVT